tara:strand:+ start:123 stop:989 length:867 start_codon:yes stop_codon:yes gene_type:complete
MVRKLWRKAWRKWSEHCSPKEEKTTSADDPEILLKDVNAQLEPEPPVKMPSEKALGKQPLSARLSGRSPPAADTPITCSQLKLTVKRPSADVPFGMTVSNHQRITEVGAGSLAEQCDVRIFDKVVAIDKVPLTDRLAAALQGKLSAKLSVERPDRSCLAQIAAREMPEGAEEWVSAVIACHNGEYDMLGACINSLQWRGEDVKTRRLTANETAGIALRTYAETGSAIHIPSESLLVEVALESGHYDLVQLLLHESGPLCQAPPKPKPTHKRQNSAGAGGSGDFSRMPM